MIDLGIERRDKIEERLESGTPQTEVDPEHDLHFKKRHHKFRMFHGLQNKFPRSTP